MLFKTLEKGEFEVLAGILLDSHEVIGPRQVGVNTDGKPIHHFLPVQSVAEIDLGYETAQYSAKGYFLPFKENLSEYDFDDEGWKQEIHYETQPRAIIGLHSCDIHGLLKLDKVFIKDYYPSPYYISRRKNTFLVGIDHEACSGGFCRSLGTDTVDHGFDLFLTDLGERYFVAVASDRGFTALQQVKTRDIAEEDSRTYLDVRRRIARSFETEVRVQNLPNVLDIEFESDVWKKWGKKCLSCGSCAMVCPTCYCYGVTEEMSMDFTRGAKVKQLYSCNLLDFALVAGGHNFRPDKETRLKYRYYHQHRGFVEIYEEPKCVGCNRCGRICLVGINPPDVIRDLQAEDRA